jgi:ATP-dependent DNA helicase RecG
VSRSTRKSLADRVERIGTKSAKALAEFASRTGAKGELPCWGAIADHIEKNVVDDASLESLWRAMVEVGDSRPQLVLLSILHASRRRNDGLARIFHDLKLMEREGSGIDMLFERLLASGRKVPTISEGTDSVPVTVPRRVVQPGVIKLLVEADRRYQLTQRERITFALIAQTEGVSTAELAEELELPDAGALRPWLGRLLSFGLVEQSGRTKATRYFVPPTLLRDAGLDALTTLTRVQPHRLRALILEDIERFPDSSKADIWRRVGTEIPERTFRRALEDLVESSQVVATGETRARRFRLKPGVSGHGDSGGQ